MCTRHSDRCTTTIPVALRQASGAVLRASRADGTFDGYMTALGHWFSYCFDAGIPLGPECDGLDDDRLLGFALYLTLGTTLTGDTVATYCASVNQYFAVHLNTPMRSKESHQLAAVIRAAKRTKLSNVPTRHALTVDELFAMLDVQRVRSVDGDVNGLRDYAMLLTAYFGLARVGEYTSHTGITRDAVQFVAAVDDRPEHVVITLRGSKTDPFSKGQRIVIGASPRTPCATALPPSSSPLRALRATSSSRQVGGRPTRSQLVCISTLRGAGCVGWRRWLHSVRAPPNAGTPTHNVPHNIEHDTHTDACVYGW
jgi:hypothetical protein